VLNGILQSGERYLSGPKAWSLAYAACDDTIQLSAVLYGAVPVLVKLLYPENSPFLLGCAADALSSLFNITQAGRGRVSCQGGRYCECVRAHWYIISRPAHYKQTVRERMQ